MKAVVNTKYGSPDVLQIVEVARPVPEDNEVLIKVNATTVETTDTIFRGGKVFSARLATGIRKPKETTPGSEFAGEVEAVGRAVKQFRVGDRVFGTTAPKMGAHAEYISVPEDGALALTPDHLSDVEAVAMHPGAMTALPNLQGAAHLQPGQKILIIGASGSIGSSAVQLARHFGAEVTGVCSTPNVAMVKSLGADRVIDYRQEDFTQSGERYDIVFDTVGKSSFSRARRVLKQGGMYLTTVLSLTILRQMLWTSKFGRKKARLVFAGLRPTEEKRGYLALLLDLDRKGAFKPVVDRTYPLEQIAEAHRYVETGRKRGTVVVTLG
ncbi:MAG: NAD(P)-dependent alcohol dehydrogenase [Anaerolineae bacterium]